MEPMEIDSKTNIRTIDVVDKLLDAARLDKNDFYPSAQTIFLGNNIANEDIKLLEVDEENLNFLLEGNNLVIRGNENENAFCCSKSKTYSFKVAEISNPLLVTSNIQIYNDKISNVSNVERELKKAEIRFMTNMYFELSAAKPKLEKLKYLLELNLYCGNEDNNNDNIKKYTINDFLDIIQSSEDEIYKYLNFIEAFNINGNWRLLDFNYLTRIIEHILKLINENSWSFDKIPINELYLELKILFPMSILNQIVKYYFIKCPTDGQYYELKKSKICRLYAEILLRSALKMRLHEFESLWKQSIPEFEVDYKMLEGLAYIEESHIYYLNLFDLPDDVERRFKYLFEKRKKWPLDDIKVYISDMCADNTEVNALLAKYCRSFNQNAIKYFSSRMN